MDFAGKKLNYRKVHTNLTWKTADLGLNYTEKSELEVRVNDYSPLLLYVWKAKTDIQFVTKSSLALAHYVSGYVTKAERSNLQEIWQDVSENKSIYSHLWSFGVRMLRFRECGLYEAADLLLGYHLTEKACTVKWVDVSMPQKHNHRLKSHRDLQRLAEHNPDSENIFEDSLVECHYLSRPERLRDMCLYDFVAWIDWSHRDKQGEKTTSGWANPAYPTTVFNHEKEEQREFYYYSLIFLFVSFRDEGNLLLPNESVEDTFHRLTNDKSLSHHKKLQNVLAAQWTITKSTTLDINCRRWEGGKWRKRWRSSAHGWGQISNWRCFRYEWLPTR